MNPTGKAAIASVGVMGPALAVLVILANRFIFKAEVITDQDVSAGVDGIAAIVGLVTGIIGRWKASKPITGLFTPAKAP